MGGWRRWLTFGILLAVAGCKDVTFKFPTDSLGSDTNPPTLDSINRSHWDAMNAFALRATQAAAKEDDSNLAFSPLGLWSISAVLLNAANGDSFETGEAVMGLKDARIDQIDNAQHAWFASLKGDSPLKQGLGFFMVWPIMVTPAFSSRMALDYQADVLKIGTAGDAATNAINGWAKRRTDGIVPKAINGLNKDTIMVVLHTVGLDAKWAEPFSDIGDGQFHTADGRVVQSPVLSKTLECPIVDDKTWEGCFLPFKDGRFGLLLATPRGGKSVRQTLAEAKFLPKATGTPVLATVTVPKFSLADKLDLRPILSDLGGNGWLQSPNNFRQMSIEFDTEAYLNRVEQTVTADFGANGFRSATTTATVSSGASVTGDSRKLSFDRPFFWAVVDRETGLYLVNGIVDDPTAQ